MNENIYLARREQKVFGAIKSADIITTEEIRGMFPEIGQQINKICSGLSKKGYLYRLKKETYLVQESPKEKPAIKNPYKVALALFKGYVGFSSALRIYNLLDYEPFTIFVVTREKSASKKIGEYVFRAVSSGGATKGIAFRDGIYVSSLAKTFFDCFYKPQYGGGYSSITKALNEADIGWKEFIKYFEPASSSLCQRTGYVLESLKEETDKKIPVFVMDFLRKRIKNNTRLVPSGASRGKYIRKWMLLDNLGKENMFSWWHYG